jgi:peptide/nickel transport system substrate-binding protein
LVVGDRHRGLTAALAAVVALALVAAGCSGGDAAPEPAPAPALPRRGGSLVYAIESDPSGLDPARNAWDYPGVMVANAVYDPMMAFDAEGRPRPYLVRSMTPDATFTRWIIELRPGVTFSDGSPLDADAAVGFVQALKAPGAVTAMPALHVVAARATAPLTVEVVTDRPWATLPALLTGQAGYVAAPRQLAEPTAAATRPVGTGPFTVDRWDIGTAVHLVRNERYWRRAEGLPRLDGVEFRVVAEGRARIEQLERGDVDVISATDDWDLAALDGARARHPEVLRVETDPGDAEKSGIVFNTTVAPVNDRRIRQAIAWATDMNAIAAAEHWRTDEVAAGPLDPRSPYHASVPYPGADVVKAQALVREYLHDPKVRDRPRDGRIKVSLQAAAGSGFLNRLVAQWARAGIDAEVSLIESKQLARVAVTGGFQLLFARSFAAPDPDVLWRFFVKDMATAPLPLNFSRLADDGLTAAMDAGRATDDPAARKVAYARAQQVLAEQLPYLWMRRAQWRVASRVRVHDARNVTLPDGRAAMPFLAGTHRLTDTWVDGA